MTLNITLASKWAIYQSSDFKLTQKSGPRLVITNMPQKQVVLKYMDWVGLLAYTGIALYDKHRTLEWLTKVLTHAPARRSLNMILRALRDEGNKWITGVPLKDRYHTFTVVAFDAKGPRVTYVSTYQKAGGQDLTGIRSTFFITSFRPKGPWYGATGSGAAHVSPESKAQLLDMVRRNEQPLAIRETIADVNRDAANRSNNEVSEECVSSHLLPDGTGEAQVFGQILLEFIPSLIMSGRNIATIVPDVLVEAGSTKPHRLVGVTWTSAPNASAMLGAYRELP
jgi:hypothetical protein